MTINPDVALERVNEQTDALDMIGKELRWMLDESQKNGAQPGTPLMKELQQKFRTLYVDFKKVRQAIADLHQTMVSSDFEDAKVGMVYRATTALLVDKCYKGIFRQFTYMAEIGRLPEEGEP